MPTNKPIRREDHNDIIYKTQIVKFNAIIEEIKTAHKRGQPTLVGTVSIETSEKLSDLLKQAGIRHNVLNAKHHEKEAEIIAQAGRLKAVTIATNMAGRGTDIVLGGNPEFLSRAELDEKADHQLQKQSLKKFQNICQEEKEKVLSAGGLYIIGTERHESRRIDNQLRGRSGRQGDPGASCFYLSLEDDLMRIFGGQNMQKVMDMLRVPDEEPITARPVTRAIARAQKRVEGHNFDVRKHLLEYDDVMNQQRSVIYRLRRSMMDLEKVERQCLDFLGEVSSYLLDTYVSEQVKSEKWNLKGLNQAVYQQFGFFLPEAFSLGSLANQALPPHVKGEDTDGNPEKLGQDSGLVSLLKSAVKEAYDAKKEELKEHFNQVAQLILLQTLDVRWKEHLENIDHLKEGINLRAYAQKDPLVEYKKESFALFERMNFQVASESVEKLFKIQLQLDEAQEGFHLQSSYDEDSLDYERPEINKSLPKTEARKPNTTSLRQLNRAQRRKQKQNLRKKKIKI